MSEEKIFRGKWMFGEVVVTDEVYREIRARMAAHLASHVSVAVLGDGHSIADALARGPMLTSYADPKPAGISADELMENIRKAVQGIPEPAIVQTPAHMRTHLFPNSDYFSGSINGINVITDPNCYKTVRKVRGVPAGRKPNRYRPYYRRVRVNTPLMYLLKPNTVICHPSLEEKIRKKFTG